MHSISHVSTVIALRVMPSIATTMNGLMGLENAAALGIQAVKCVMRIVKDLHLIQTSRWPHECGGAAVWDVSMVEAM